MGFFNLFKSSTSSIPSNTTNKDYQHDSYYVNRKANGDEVISFESRKKKSFPSHRGLWVAEILLLHYCSYGTYPHPQNGYPGFWWFEYGIRDVEKHLSELEAKGFIRKALPHESLLKMTVPEIKNILTQNSLSTTGKKAELIERVLGNIDFEKLKTIIQAPKYHLTELGIQEVEDNYYIPYIHKNKNNPTIKNLFGDGFNVWEVNLRLHERPGALWLNILQDMLPEGVFWDFHLDNKLVTK